MSNRVDFDDLVIFAARALKNEETRRRWENRFSYIIVDEMQDTSLLEYEVLKRIFGGNNLMMCGDFFQSIYEWRGSKPQYVLQDFIERYRAKVYMFSENYRSTKLLTRATFGYLRNTYPDLMGKYCPQDVRIHSEQDGEKILCIGFDNRREEGIQIYRYV
jgi:DNA helicase-2/ATP-dependent DNA helicase PcrA